MSKSAEFGLVTVHLSVSIEVPLKSSAQNLTLLDTGLFVIDGKSLSPTFVLPVSSSYERVMVSPGSISRDKVNEGVEVPEPETEEIESAFSLSVLMLHPSVVIVVDPLKVKFNVVAAP